MLLASALRIQKSDGLPDEGGQLQTFTAVYHVNICCTKSPILTLQPLLTCSHVADNNICIPPDIFIGICDTIAKGKESKLEANK